MCLDDRIPEMREFSNTILNLFRKECTMRQFRISHETNLVVALQTRQRRAAFSVLPKLVPAVPTTSGAMLVFECCFSEFRVIVLEHETFFELENNLLLPGPPQSAL